MLAELEAAAQGLQISPTQLAAAVEVRGVRQEGGGVGWGWGR